MSSKLRLSSPEAKEAFEAIMRVLSVRAKATEEAIAQAKAIVSLWSRANLDLYDDEVIPFRSINEPLMRFDDAAEEAAARKNVMEVYGRASQVMIKFIEEGPSIE